MLHDFAINHQNIHDSRLSNEAQLLTIHIILVKVGRYLPQIESQNL